MVSLVHEAKQPALPANERGLTDQPGGNCVASLPVFLSVTGRECLVVGGQVAGRRVATLLDCRAAVTVVSPRTTPFLDGLFPDQIQSIRRPGLTRAVSTDGRSPAFSRWLRDEIERFLTSEDVELLAIAADVRAELLRAGANATSDRWQASLADELLDLLRHRRADDARARVREALIAREGSEC